MPAIAAKLADNDFDVLFLAGVGEVFPYIRSHNVLNNLQSTAKEKPTVLFFPGAYTRQLVKTLEEKQFPQHYYPHGTPTTEEAGADTEKTETSTTPVLRMRQRIRFSRNSTWSLKKTRKGSVLMNFSDPT